MKNSEIILLNIIFTKNLCSCIATIKKAAETLDFF